MNKKELEFLRKQEGFKEIGNIIAINANSSKSKWNFLTETHTENRDMFDYDDVYDAKGCFINVSNDFPSLAKRIYSDYGYALFPGQFDLHYDEIKFIQELQKRQGNVKLTIFPYGVLTMNEYTIGQIIPFHLNTKTLYQIAKNDKCDLEKIYLGIIDALREMYENGISYCDIHGKNILFRENDTKPIFIDFDTKYTHLDEVRVYNQQQFSNLIYLLNVLNEKCGVGKYFKYTESWDSMYDQTKTLLKK